MENNKNQRVLLIDNDGLSHYTSYLARGLARYREIILYGFSKEDYIVTGAAKEKRIEFHCIGEKLSQGNVLAKIIGRPLILFCILFTVLLANKKKYDIVHIQGHLPMFFLFVPLLKIKKKKIIWTLHDVNLRESYSGIKGKLELLYVNMITQAGILRKYSQIIIVHGLFLKKQLEAKGVDEGKIYVMPHFDFRYLVHSSDYNNNNNNNNIDNNTTHYNNKNYYNSNEEFNDHVCPKKYILVFGRISPYKGIDILINAAKIIRRRILNNYRKDGANNSNLEILIAGKGDTSYFDRLLTKEERQYIHLYNAFIPNREIPVLFNKARFLVLSYVDASQSGVIPLAYTFSKPVIVSNVGSLVEYVDHGKTGYIFEAGNTAQLADYIKELLDDNNKCIEMGRNAYQKLIQEMSLEKCSAIMNDIYNKKRL
jgi:glycosyltransferase involved in cell wall biosynthesis